MLWHGDDDAGEFKAEDEGWADEGTVVLVLAAAVEEVDEVEAGVADCDEDLGGGGSRCRRFGGEKLVVCLCWERWLCCDVMCFGRWRRRVTGMGVP